MILEIFINEAKYGQKSSHKRQYTEMKNQMSHPSEEEKRTMLVKMTKSVKLPLKHHY